jgi:glycosyltransferase involved in cell wall biosynthesis
MITSTDNTLEILTTYMIYRFCRPKQIQAGPNKGRNMGIKACTGTWICIADHDDLWEPFKLKKFLPHLDTAPIPQVVIHWVDKQKGSKTVRIRFPEEPIKTLS